MSKAAKANMHHYNMYWRSIPLAHKGAKRMHIFSHFHTLFLCACMYICIHVFLCVNVQGQIQGGALGAQAPPLSKNIPAYQASIEIASSSTPLLTKKP